MTAFVVGLACLFGPPSPLLRSGGDHVSAARVCTDTFAPRPHPHRALPVRPFGRVRVDMRAGTQTFSATLRGRAGELPVAAVGDSRRRFVVRLPRRLGQRPVLDLRTGDAAFAARLEPPPPAAPPKPVLRAGGKRLVMARGSYCWSTPPVGLCVDTRPPVTKHALPVRPGGKVRVDMRMGTDLVGASIRGGVRNVRVEPVAGSGRRFVVHLVPGLPKRVVLELFARYPQGDGSFGARLRTLR